MMRWALCGLSVANFLFILNPIPWSAPEIKTMVLGVAIVSGDWRWTLVTIVEWWVVMSR